MKTKNLLAWILVLLINIPILIVLSTAGCKPTPPEHSVIVEVGDNKTADLGEEVTFYASVTIVSPISKETSITYSWDWDGDGNYDETSKEALITHIYDKAGTYAVTLKVTAYDDTSATDTLTITINDINKNPIADPGGPYNATVEEKLIFDGSASSDSDGKIIKYAWDFGDGSIGSGAKPIHTYTEAGKYTVILTVKDDDNDLSTKATTTATIEPIKEVLTDPTIKLEIYEGPTYAEAGSICYYRVEAIVTGNPTPAIEFSKDNSNGAWGLKKAQINLYNSDETYSLTATATNSEGTDSDSIKLGWKDESWAVDPTGDYYYKLTTSMNWLESEAKAVEWGGHLITLRSREEELWIKTVFGKYEWFWIGFNDIEEEGNWVWSSGELVTYTNWHPGEPNNCGGQLGECLPEDCAVMNWNKGEPPVYGDYWNDLQESDDFRGIVEVKIE